MLLDMKSNFGRSRTPTVIQYMSDLHLERLDYQYTLTPAAPNLLLAGDIGRLSDTAKYRSFLTHCSTQFTKILLVAGNHEYYGTSHSQGHQLLNSITNDPATQGKILFLHRATYDVPDTDITIAGCTLHSRIDDRTSLTNDFKRIREWSVDQHNAEHGADMAWLKSTLAQVGEGRRVIVATHYAPEVEGSCHPMYRGSKLNQCFASDALSELQSCLGANKVTHWVYGHTHWNTRFRRGRTLVVSNQRCSNVGELSWWRRMTLYRPFDMSAVIEM